MFDVGFWELIILFGLGLVILGPERLPKVAMQLGNWAGQARRMARTLTTQIRDELDIDVNKPFNTTYTPTTSSKSDFRRPGVDDLKPKDESESHSYPDDDTPSEPSGDEAADDITPSASDNQ
jgi:sec-independent protein translocase protein TatB